jgi:hypothetical protein
LIQLGDQSFETLAGEIAFCLENIRVPGCTMDVAGRFYEEAAEALRAHAILRLLVDGDPNGFSNDLVMSGQSRRGWLRRCARQNYADYFLALSRSASMVDAMAGDDFLLAEEILALSPTAFRPGDEYEDDFYWQRFLGLHLGTVPSADADAALAALAENAKGARVALAKALRSHDAEGFDEAFRDFLAEREAENAEDEALADEDAAVAAGTQVFVEGVAVLKLARKLGLEVADEYPMCPTLAFLAKKPATPADEFDQP